jgi:integrase
LLLTYREQGLAPPADLQVWVKGLGEPIHNQLVKFGVCRSKTVCTIGKLCEAQLERATAKGLKESTFVNLRVAQANLINYFGRDRRAATITLEEATKYKLWLLTAGGKRGKALAPPTAGIRCARTQAMFNIGIENRWIKYNPFAKLGPRNDTNPDNELYIPWNDVTAILDRCTCPRFKLFVALTRLCAIRAPSDVLPLRWEQFDRGLGLFRVGSQKKNSQRDIPIFEELMPFLDDAWDLAPKGEPLIFFDLQITRAALMSRMEVLCRKTGIPLWKRPLNNLRGSAERDMCRALPYDEYAAIIDHTPETAAKHYNRFAKELRSRAEGRTIVQPNLSWGGTSPGALPAS